MTHHARLWVFGVTLGLSVTAAAQQSSQTFEVVSVRRGAPGETGGRVQFLPGGRFLAQNVPIQFLIEQVYGVRDFQVVAAPQWRAVIADGRDNRYYVDARGPETATRQQLQEMVKRLLADRFGLKLHIEQRALPVYALVVAPRGVKGTRPAEGNPGGIALMTRGWIRALEPGVRPAQIAQVLSREVDRPVIDQTKVEHFLVFDLTWTPSDPFVAGAAPPDPGCSPDIRQMAETLKWQIENVTCPSMFTAIEEQIGLRLQPQNAPLDVLVIDAVQPPPEN